MNLSQECYTIEEIPEHFPFALKKYLTEVSKMETGVLYPAPFTIKHFRSIEEDLNELEKDIIDAGGIEAYYEANNEKAQELHQNHVKFTTLWCRGIYMGNNGCTFFSVCDPVTEKVYAQDMDEECSAHTLYKTKLLEEKIDGGVPLWKFLGYKSSRCNRRK